MPIIEYANSVFTNDGQSSVAEFAVKLARAAPAILLAGEIAVIVGYHGDGTGRFYKKFTAAEMADVRGMSRGFPQANLVELDYEMSGAQIYDTVKEGRVFFTWCDSDTRVRAVMAGEMPAVVARH